MTKIETLYIETNKRNIRPFKKTAEAVGLNYEIVSPDKSLDIFLDNNSSVHYIIGEINKDEKQEHSLIEEIIKKIRDKNHRAKITIHSDNCNLLDLASRNKVYYQKRYTSSTGTLIRKILESRELLHSKLWGI